MNPRELVDVVAALIEEFDLSEATLMRAGFRVSFRRTRTKAHEVELPEEAQSLVGSNGAPASRAAPAETAKPKGTPVESPMNGIFYNSPSPSSPPFVRPGDEVTMGQTIGLIEAMKVFNEIPCPVSGTVLQAVAESGSVVLPGDVLLYVG